MRRPRSYEDTSPRDTWLSPPHRLLSLSVARLLPQQETVPMTYRARGGGSGSLVRLHLAVGSTPAGPAASQQLIKHGRRGAESPTGQRGRRRDAPPPAAATNRSPPETRGRP